MSATSSRPRIGFLGTPEFAAHILRALHESGEYEIALAITETDKPAGRGHKLQAPPVKLFASSAGIPVAQPEKLRGFVPPNGPFDVLVSASYGKIIPQSLLRLPKFGVLNVHASLLPRWRGAAPIHRALFAGDTETGVCIMQTEKGLDTGPVFSEQRVAIEAADTFGTLHEKLQIAGAELLLATLPGILRGETIAKAQPLEGATYAEKWLSPDRDIIWSEPAAVTVRRIRACAPDLGARTQYGEAALKVFGAHQVADQNFPKFEPGQVVEVNRAELIIAAGAGEFVAVDELQFPGKAKLPIKQVLAGRRLSPGDWFGAKVSNQNTD